MVEATSPEAPDAWRRLDGRMVAVDATRLAVALLPLAIAITLHNTDAATAVSALRTIAIVGIVRAVIDLVRWARTSYRITPERVEVRSGLLTLRHLSVPRDRIRRVVATARPRHRIFGLTVVTIATGDRPSSNEDVLTLDAVATGEADDLRHELLRARTDARRAADRSGVRPTDDRPTEAAPPGTRPTDAGRIAGQIDGEPLALLDRRWAPYALLSFATLAVPALVLGGLLQALQSVGVEPDDVANPDGPLGRAPDLSPTAWLAVAALGIIVVAAVGALALFVEAWWGYRLIREPGGHLRIHRGLLTQRSLSLDESRLRGVEVTEPLPLRVAHGARLYAVTTGEIGSDAPLGLGAGALMPAAPRRDVQRVAAAVLDERSAPTDRPDLRPHPPAARRRRLVRAYVVAAAAWAAVGIAVAGAGAPAGVMVAPALVTGGGVAYALDAYRSLGHALDRRHLIVRRGSIVRRTVALQCTGVIGWTVRSTVFQRRLGLATVVATTAAGRGAYELVDVGLADGLQVADRTAPGILGPFLTASDADSAQPTA
jgi:putative membrane protein